MRILIAGTAYYPATNGQAIFTENLTEGLAACGHEVLSIAPSGRGEAYSEIRNNVHIEAIRGFSINWIHPESYVSFFSQKAIRKIFQDFRPEVVHIQDHYPLSRDVIHVAKEFGVGLIGTNHFMPDNIAAYAPVISNIKPLFNKIAWAWVLDAYNRLNVVTAQSKASAALLREQGLLVPVQPVSCGLDIHRFKKLPALDRKAVREHFGIDPQKTIFLFVGRVDHEKRLDVLLRALKMLDRADIQVVIAGHGADQDNLKKFAAELELGERVVFTGFVPAEELPALFNAADIFAMPSEAELLSIASLEAMACGLPVLLANAVALPELAADGTNGYLFRPGDPADAARRMQLLADHPERWMRMGASSLEKAAFHSNENTIKQYESLYANMLAGIFSKTPAAEIKTIPRSSNLQIGNKK